MSTSGALPTINLSKVKPCCQTIPVITPLVLYFITFGVHQQVQACGGVYNASSGSITSPLYPSQYPPNQDCVYIINAATGHRITVEFLRFQLADETKNCEHDYLQIRDGGLSTSPFMETFCGTTTYRRRSSSNTMWIKFHSDSSQSGAGFEADYTTGPVVSRDVSSLVYIFHDINIRTGDDLLMNRLCSSYINMIPQKFFVFTVSQYPTIYRTDLETLSHVTIPIDGLQEPVAIDYDPQESRIYWTDRRQKTIRSANLNGTDVRLVRSLGPDAVPDGLCVDSLSRLIFYTDAGNKVIGMITMYSNTHRIVINSSLDKPKDIELDKHNGVMYWSDCGTTPTIERANYDGTGRQTLVSGGEYLNQPNALALDTQGGRLYWADGGTQYVGWVDLEGRKTSVILHKDDSLFQGMDIYLNDLFISDWDFLNSNQSIKSHIYRYGVDGTYQDMAVWSIGRLNDIRVYAEETEDKESNGCGNNNGGCSYICIPTPSNRSKCLTDGTESAKRDDVTTGSTTTSRGLVTSNSTGEPTKLPGTESASTNTVIIIVVCVIAGVVVITVVVALVVVFKLRRKRNCKQPTTLTMNTFLPNNARYQQAFTPNDDCVDGASIQQLNYGDIVFSLDTAQDNDNRTMEQSNYLPSSQ